MSRKRSFVRDWPKKKILAAYDKIGADLIGQLPEAARSESKARCKTCDHKWSPKFGSVYQGQGCPKCSGNILLAQWPKVRILAVYDKINVDLIGPLPKNAKDKSKVRCWVCNHEWSPIFNSVQQGCGCAKCVGLLPLTQWPKEKILAIYNKANLDLIGRLPKKVKDKPRVRCRACSYRWAPSFHHVQDGSGCPGCKRSKGEEYIAKTLRFMGIDFETEKRFSTCRNKRTLPFDFFIPIANLLIEYQGRHHFENVWGALSNVKRNDKIKADWVAQSPCELLYINYWDYECIAEILADRLPDK